PTGVVVVEAGVPVDDARPRVGDHPVVDAVITEQDGLGSVVWDQIENAPPDGVEAATDGHAGGGKATNQIQGAVDGVESELLDTRSGPDHRDVVHVNRVGVLAGVGRVEGAVDVRVAWDLDVGVAGERPLVGTAVVDERLVPRQTTSP